MMKPPLDKKDNEEQKGKILASGGPTISLQNFIDDLLVEAIADNNVLPTFYSLVRDYNLTIYDKIMDKTKDGKIISPQKIVSPNELILYLQERDQQREQSSNENWNNPADSKFKFWEETIVRKYTIFKNDLAIAYNNAGKLKFPWFNWDNKLVWLDVIDYCGIDTENDNNRETEVLLNSYSGNSMKVQFIGHDQTNKIEPRKKHRDNEALILLEAALDQMESVNGKTPTAIEFAVFVLSDFKHPNIQKVLNAEQGLLINNRTLLLIDGTRLDKSGILRRFRRSIKHRRRVTQAIKSH